MIQASEDSAHEVRLWVLSHACLYIEFGDARLLVDPWLAGSCYWRSWWNYPEVDSTFVKSLKPTHIYITHLHWDHYHGPSLRLFEDQNPVILVPKAATSRMKSDMCRDFSFSDVIEIGHGDRYELCQDFGIYSYQFNPWIIDSSLVVSVGGRKLFNANDSKVFGLSLRQIIKNHAPFDFVFRSHSSAVQIPYCIDSFGSVSIPDRPPAQYAKEFSKFCLKTGARYAIPFASSHVYLRPESLKFNSSYNSPGNLKVYYEGLSRGDSKQECVLMPAGSAWSSISGFSIRSHDYSNINTHIDEMLEMHSASLGSALAKESKSKPNELAFRKYFKRFLASLVGLPGLGFRFGFLVTSDFEPGSGGFLSVVDLGRREIVSCGQVERQNEYELLSRLGLSFLLKVPTVVFNDCNQKSMYNVWGPSKLVRIFLSSKRDLRRYQKFCWLIDLYENDGLPFWSLLNPRQLVNRISRWRELVDAFGFLFKTKILGRPVDAIWD